MPNISDGILKTSISGTEKIPVSGAGTPALNPILLNFGLFSQQIDDYTLVLSDAFKEVQVSKSSAVTLTVPPNASVAFEIGVVILVKRTGAGVLTIAQGAGVTITASAGVLTDPGQNVTMVLKKTGTNTWEIQNGAPFVYSVSDLAVLVDRNGGTYTSTNQPNSEQGFPVTIAIIRQFDATNYNYVRLCMRVHIASTSVNSPRAYPQFDDDVNTSLNFQTVGAGTVVSGEAVDYSTTGWKSTSWIALPPAAKADVWWRIAEHGGDGVNDPQFSNVSLQFRT